MVGDKSISLIDWDRESNRLWLLKKEPKNNFSEFQRLPQTNVQ